MKGIGKFVVIGLATGMVLGSAASVYAEEVLEETEITVDEYVSEAAYSEEDLTEDFSVLEETLMESEAENPEEELLGGSSILSAGNISFGTTYKGTLTCPAQEYYQMNLNSGGLVRFTFDKPQANNFLHMYVYGSDGNTVYGQTEWFTETGLVCSMYLNKGSYYIMLETGSYQTTNYAVKVDFTAEAESFQEMQGGSDNTFAKANAIKMGDTCKGLLTKDDLVDTYKVTLAEAGKVHFAAEVFPEAVTYELYDAAQNCLFRETLYRGHVFDWNLTKGTYYLQIKQASLYGKYSFKTSFTSAGESFLEAQGGSNNSFDKASGITRDKTYKGQLAINDRVDIYRFSIGESGTYTFTFTGTQAYMGFKIYDANKAEVGGQDLYSNTEPWTRQDRFELNKGTYYLHVHANVDSTANYSFNISRHIERIAMYRVYNPNSGEHFYTSNKNEKNGLVQVGWKDEGIGWYAPEKGTTVYRLYNAIAGEHHYTTNKAERNNLVRLGWNDEGIGWYSSAGKEVPVYRQYNPNMFANNHNYTTSKGENDYLVRLGWKAEGICWYGV